MNESRGWSLTIRQGIGTIEFRPSLLGVGLLLGFVLLMYRLEGAPPYSSQAHALLWGAPVGALVGCAAAVLFRQPIVARPDAERVLGCATTLAGCLLIIVGLALGLPWCGPAGGALLSLAGTVWLQIYSEIDPLTSLFHATISACLAGAICAAGAGLAESGTAILVYATPATVGAAAALGCAQPRGDTIDTADEAPPPPLVSAPTDITPAAALPLRSFARDQWVPLVGIMLVAFVFGLRWSSASAGLGAGKQGLLGGGEYLIGPLLASLLVWVSVFHGRRSAPQRTAFRTLIPVAAAIMLVIPVINPVRGFYKAIDPSQPPWMALTAVLDALNEAAVALLFVSAFVSVAAAPRTSGVSPLLAGSSLLGCGAIGFLFGTGSYQIVRSDGAIVCFVAWTCYLLVLGFVGFSGTRDERQAEQMRRETVEVSIARASGVVARRFGLSEREGEVLRFLARGYSYAHIAQEMFISENTVRTHAKHIYAKVGVAGREGLFSVIDEVLAPQEP